MKKNRKQRIKYLIYNLEDKQEDIFYDIKLHPKQWFKYLNKRNRWLSLSCNFIEGVNCLHIIILGCKLHIIGYYADIQPNNNYYIYNTGYFYHLYNKYDKVFDDILFDGVVK
jgi:hypothetical protein